MFNAKIIADSQNEFGNRITTFVVTFPRIILSEFNTHRALSRNSASSRAIPFEKMLKSVQENPFVPIKWMKDHKGMQGNEYFTDTDKVRLNGWHQDVTAEYAAIHEWNGAKSFAISQAINLNKLGVTKQFINRLLEPFMWHTVIVTATEWENFFALRAHDAAEIHMQKLAYMMLEEYNKSQPKLLKDGEWHIPFENKIDIKANENLDFATKMLMDEIAVQMKIKVSTAMCARVSYTIVGNEEKENDFIKDIELHDKLKSMGHMSPFEHCAMAPKGCIVNDIEGNFRGFIQYRKTIENENKNDNRVIKK